MRNERTAGRLAAAIAGLTLVWAFVAPAHADPAVAESAPDGGVVADAAFDATAAPSTIVAPAPAPPIVAPAPAPPRIDETIVVAPARPPRAPLEDQAASASVVTGARLPRSGESLPQLLSELPGVAVTRLGGLGGSAFLSVRGSTWEQVAIYVDGIPLNVAAGGQVDLSTIALGSIDRIEVYRAMTPIAFGTSALGGIVSISTRLPDATSAQADAGAGSFGTRFGGAAAAYAGDRLRVYGAVHLLDTRSDFSYNWDNGTILDPSDDETRVRQNNQVAQGDGVLRARLSLGGRRWLVASLSGLDRRQGLAGFGTRLASDARLTTRRGTASLSYVGDDDLGPAGRLSGQLYTVVTQERFRDPLRQIGFVTSDSRDLTTTWGATLRARRALGTALKLAGIVDGRYERFVPVDRNDRGEMSGDVATRLFAATGAEADLWWARANLNVIPSLRWEMTRDQRSGRDNFGDLLPAGDAVTTSDPLGRLGLVQRPTETLALKANLGRYVRRPNFTELFGNSGLLLGNPELQTEKAINGDVGLSWRSSSADAAISLDGALFAAWVHDLIQYQQSAYRSFPRNIARARIVGVELGADARVGQHARLVGQVTFNDARDAGSATSSHERQLPLRPRLRAYARPEVRALHAGPVAVSLYVDADVTSGNFQDPANLVPLPSRLLLGAGASVAWPRGGLRLTASLQNLSDSLISDVAGYPLPGRAIYLTLAGHTNRQDERTDLP